MTSREIVNYLQGRNAIGELVANPSWEDIRNSLLTMAIVDQMNETIEAVGFVVFVMVLGDALQGLTEQCPDWAYYYRNCWDLIVPKDIAEDYLNYLNSPQFEGEDGDANLLADPRRQEVIHAFWDAVVWIFKCHK